MGIGDPDCWMPSEVEDPRKPKGMRHPLPAVLALSVCAMLNGARSLYAIAQWGWEHPQFAQPLGFSRERTPCVATLHNVFRCWAAGPKMPGRWGGHHCHRRQGHAGDARR